MNEGAIEMKAGRNDLGPTQAVSPAAGGVAGSRFAYASGARPLDGYTIKRGIGIGGFGEVYFAVSDAGKEVALKLIRRNLDVELRGVRQCLNIRHPNLVEIYDIRTDEHENHWIVMEYVRGKSLEQALDEHPEGLPYDEALAWFAGIAAGVAHLHDQGIVHRDLKPANIFSDGGLVKIGDYGLSKFISVSRRSGQTESVGTVHYMAPEIANGRYGKQIDIYALGVILFEIITGRVPFDGESVGEVLMKHLTAEPDLSGLAEPYRTAIGRALAKDPQRRIDSATALAAMLPQPRVLRPMTVGGPSVGAGGAAASERRPRRTEQKAARERPPVRLAAGAGSGGPAAGPTRAVTPAQIVTLVLAGLLVMLLAARGGVQVFAPLGAPMVRIMPPWSWSAMLVAGLVVLAVTAARSRRGHRSSRADSDVVLRDPEGPRRQPIPPQTRRPPAAEAAEAALVLKPVRERAAELLGSLLVSAVVAAVMPLILLPALVTTVRPEQVAWVVLTGTAAAWCVLLTTKLWEGTHGDGAMRRFVMLLVGMLVGLTATVLANALLVFLPFGAAAIDGLAFRTWAEQVLDGPAHAVSGLLYDTQGQPRVLAAITYFGLLFLMMRWWLLADPLRRRRVSIWAVVLSVFWAWLISVFWPFPQPWGMLIAAVAAVAVQLASPWTRRHRGRNRELPTGM